MGNKRHRPVVDCLDSRLLLSTTPQGLTPGQIKTAYGLSNVSFNVGGLAVPANGTNETIAVIVAYHDRFLAQDLTTFDNAFALSTPTNNTVVAGKPWLIQLDLAGTKVDSGWAGEESLDSEWTHALAPGANLLVVEAASDSTADLMQAVLVARNTPGVSVVSMSWGGSEDPSQLAYDTFFTTPAGHTGITYIAASGDNGASGGAEWPASSPNVVSVGGSTLATTSSGAYLAESTWSGSGGGYSAYEVEPAYQYSKQTTGAKSVPDVTFDGDPNSGVSVYTTDPTTGVGSWSVVGGTSVGTPAWAGIIAVADQGLALTGVPSFDGATQTLPTLYTLPTTDFHAVAPLTVSVGGRGGFGGRYPFVQTTPASLGSPNGVSLLDGLTLGRIAAFNGAPTLGNDAIVLGSTTTKATTTATPTATSPSTAVATPTLSLGGGWWNFRPGAGSGLGFGLLLDAITPALARPAQSIAPTTLTSSPLETTAGLFSSAALITSNPVTATIHPLPFQNAPRFVAAVDEILRRWEDEVA